MRSPGLRDVDRVIVARATVRAVSAWWGAISWGGAGLALAVLLRLLPPWRGSSWLLAPVVGLAGAVGGGALATALGFGGVAAFDWRSLVAAGLAALLAMLLLALLRTRGAGGQRARRS